MSWQAFFQGGGHIWAAWGMTAVVFLWLLLSTKWQRVKINRAQQRQRLREQQFQQQSQQQSKQRREAARVADSRVSDS